LKQQNLPKIGKGLKRNNSFGDLSQLSEAKKGGPVLEKI
jgi:hypothetical protein